MSGFLLALAFLTGVLLHDSGAGIVLVIPVGLAALLGLRLTSGRASRIVIAFGIACACAGAWRAQSGIDRRSPVVVSLSGTDRYISATVVGKPRTNATRTTASIRLQGLPEQSEIASLPLLPVLSAGDEFRFWAPVSWDAPVPGQVAIPVSSGGQLFIPSVEVVSSNGSRVDQVRTSIGNSMTNAVERYIPEPSGSLTLGIMTGDDSGMTNATRASFRAAGMSHITAVSGWNVAIVAGIVIVMLRRLSVGRTVPALLASGAIWSYAFLVGMEPSVVRAAGMASIFLVAHWRGRPGDLLTSLALTTAVVIAITPAIRFDIGFQLSVAATLGIVLLLEVSDTRPWWHSAIAVPVVGELAVAPVLLHHLGTYSVLSPVANLASAPLVELVMLGGAATLVASALHPALGNVVGIMTWVPARLIVAIAEKTASFTWASSSTVTIGWSTTLLVYLAMIGVYLAWLRWYDSHRDARSAVGDYSRI